MTSRDGLADLTGAPKGMLERGVAVAGDAEDGALVGVAVGAVVEEMRRLKSPTGTKGVVVSVVVPAALGVDVRRKAILSLPTPTIEVTPGEQLISWSPSKIWKRSGTHCYVSIPANAYAYADVHERTNVLRYHSNSGDVDVGILDWRL